MDDQLRKKDPLDPQDSKLGHPNKLPYHPNTPVMHKQGARKNFICFGTKRQHTNSPRRNLPLKTPSTSNTPKLNVTKNLFMNANESKRLHFAKSNTAIFKDHSKEECKNVNKKFSWIGCVRNSVTNVSDAHDMTARGSIDRVGPIENCRKLTNIKKNSAGGYHTALSLNTKSDVNALSQYPITPTLIPYKRPASCVNSFEIGRTNPRQNKRRSNQYQHSETYATMKGSPGSEFKDKFLRTAKTQPFLDHEVQTLVSSYTSCPLDSARSEALGTVCPNKSGTSSPECAFSQIKEMASVHVSPTAMAMGGLKNAGLKSLPKLSEEFANEVKESFQGPDSSTSAHVSPIIPTMCGFKSAEIKPLPELSKESVAKAEEVLQRLDNRTYSHAFPIMPNMDGFKSAGLKPNPELSKESIAKAKEFFQSPDNYTYEHVSPIVPNMHGSNSAKHKPLSKLSEESINKAKELLQHTDSHTSEHVYPAVPNMYGFKSAGSKPPPELYEKSIVEAKELLQHADNHTSEHVSPAMPNTHGFKSAGSKPPPELSENSIAEAKEFLQNLDPCTSTHVPPIVPTMDGFKSAGLKPLPELSKESIAKVKVFFQSQDNYTSEHAFPIVPDMYGFKSAGHKPLPKLSEESVAKAKEFLQYPDDHTSEHVSPAMPNTHGFKSAGHKPIAKLSEESVAKAKEFLRYSDNHTSEYVSPAIPDTHGFKSAGSKPLPVPSKNSMAEAKEFLQYSDHCSSAHVLPGITTMDRFKNSGCKPLPELLDDSTLRAKEFLGFRIPPMPIMSPSSSNAPCSPQNGIIRTSPSQKSPTGANSLSTKTSDSPNINNSFEAYRASQSRPSQDKRHENSSGLNNLLKHRLALNSSKMDRGTYIHNKNNTCSQLKLPNIAKANHIGSCTRQSTECIKAEPYLSKSASFTINKRDIIECAANGTNSKKYAFSSFTSLKDNALTSSLDHNLLGGTEVPRKTSLSGLLDFNMDSITLPQSKSNIHIQANTDPFKEHHLRIPKTPKIYKVSDDEVKKALEDLNSSLDMQLDFNSLLLDNSQVSQTSKEPSKLIKNVGTSQVPKRSQFTSPFKKGFDARSPVSSPTKKSDSTKCVKLFNITISKPRKTLRDLYVESIDLQCMDEYCNLNLPTNSESSLKYRFTKEIDICGVIEKVEWGPSDAHSQLLQRGANPNICTREWVSNHYRWIVWKLASLYRRFPLVYKEKWSHTKVVDQLSYRYEKEVNLCRSSILKKISEGDSPPGNHMVLCVSRILTRDKEPLIDMDGLCEPLLEMTDGWYQLICIPDNGLLELIKKGAIFPGCKLSICCARLYITGISMPILEARSKVKLLIWSNSTRKAKPWKKLGLQRKPMFSVRIASIKDRGPVPMVDVLIVQKYPLQYYIKQDGSAGYFVNSKANDRIAQKVIPMRENMIRDTTSYRKNIEDTHFEPVDSMDCEIDTGKLPDITSTPVMKLIIRDYRSFSDVSHSADFAELLIWNVDDQTESFLSKGKRFKIYDVEASEFTRKYEGANIRRLNSKRSTFFSPQKVTIPLHNYEDDPRMIPTSCAQLKILVDHFHISEGEEIYVMGVVIACGETRKLDVARNGFEFERGVIISDNSFGLAFIRILGTTKMDIFIEKNWILTLANVTYRGYDETFNMYNLEFTVNSYLTRSQESSTREYSHAGSLTRSKLEEPINDTESHNPFYLPPNFYECLPEIVKSLIKNL